MALSLKGKRGVDPPRRRNDAWSFGSLAVIAAWQSLDRWIGMAEDGAGLASLAMTIGLAAGVVVNCWLALRGFVGPGTRERGPSVSTQGQRPYITERTDSA